MVKVYEDTAAIEAAIERVIAFMKEQPGNALLRELDEHLTAATIATTETCKVSSVKMVIKLKPLAAEGVMETSFDITSTIPRLPKPSAVFYATPNGHLSRHDSRQDALDLKTVAKPAHASAEPITLPAKPRLVGEG